MTQSRKKFYSYPLFGRRALSFAGGHSLRLVALFNSKVLKYDNIIKSSPIVYGIYLSCHRRVQLRVRRTTIAWFGWFPPSTLKSPAFTLFILSLFFWCFYRSFSRRVIDWKTICAQQSHPRSLAEKKQHHRFASEFGVRIRRNNVVLAITVGWLISPNCPVRVRIQSEL